MSCRGFNAHPTRFLRSHDSHRPSLTNCHHRLESWNWATRHPGRCTSHPAKHDRSHATTYDALIALLLASRARLDLADDVCKIVPTRTRIIKRLSRIRQLRRSQLALLPNPYSRSDINVDGADCRDRDIACDIEQVRSRSFVPRRSCQHSSLVPPFLIPLLRRRPYLRS